MKIKILEILPTLNYCGGAEAYVINYFRHMNKTDLQIDFLIHGSPKSENYISEVRALGAKVFQFPSFSIGSLPKIKKQFKKLLKDEKYDVIHDHMANSAFLYFSIAKKMGVKYRVLHSHQSKAADTCLHSLRNMPLLSLGKVYSTSNMACSKKAGDFLFKKEKYTILNNAIDSKLYQFSDHFRAEERNRFGFTENNKIIGHIGRLCPQKNQCFLIDIFYLIHQTNPEFRLVLVGEGEDQKKILKKIEEKGLQSAIKLIPSTKETYKIYSLFDILCLPSLYEGIPTVGIEATYNGLPILASDRITTELNFGGNVSYLPLKGKKVWAKSAIAFATKSNNRKPPMNQDFDINHQADHLSCYYKNLVKCNNAN